MYYSKYLSLFGLFLSWNVLCRCSVTNFLILSGDWFGTSLNENLPITLRGITVLDPASLNAPSIPAEENCSKSKMDNYKSQSQIKC